MGDNSKIAWTDATWNFLLGCEKVSAGCKYCYAMSAVHRMSFHPNVKVSSANAGLTRKSASGDAEWTGVVRFIPERIRIPLQWARPRMIFVNSLSDIGHPSVEDSVIYQMLDVMQRAPRHVFQVLSKRADRLARIIEMVLARGCPPRNAWWGVTVEDQAQADKRLPHLLSTPFTPAVMRWISVEPMLGPIDLRPWLTGRNPPAWVVCGGESGAKARAFDVKWAEDLAAQCNDAGVPFFMKQLGAAGFDDYKNPRSFPDSLQIFQWPRFAPGWVLARDPLDASGWAL